MFAEKKITQYMYIYIYIYVCIHPRMAEDSLFLEIQKSHTTIYVPAYYYMCVLMLLYMRLHTSVCVSSYYYIFVLTLLICVTGRRPRQAVLLCGRRGGRTWRHGPHDCRSSVY
jgi:hypothetical protein